MFCAIWSWPRIHMYSGHICRFTAFLKSIPYSHSPLFYRRTCRTHPPSCWFLSWSGRRKSWALSALLGPLNTGKLERQAGAELGQAQLKLELELELSFTWFRFCFIQLIDKKKLLATLTATSKYLPLSISSQNLFTSMPTYLHTSLLTCFLVCLLAFLLWLAR